MDKECIYCSSFKSIGAVYPENCRGFICLKCQPIAKELHPKLLESATQQK